MFSSSLRVGRDQFTTANQGQTTFFWRSKARGARLIVRRQAKKTWSVPDLGFQPGLRTRVNKGRRVDDEFRPAAGMHRHDRADRGAGDVGEHSSVQHRRAALTITLSSLRIGLSAGVGSCSNTSSPAPAMRRAAQRLVERLFVHHRAARHVDRNTRVVFMSASSRAPTRPRVSSLSRQVTTTKSDARITVSPDRRGGRRCSPARAFRVRVGRQQLQIKGAARRRSSLPIRPAPIDAQRAAGEAGAHVLQALGPAPGARDAVLGHQRAGEREHEGERDGRHRARHRVRRVGDQHAGLASSPATSTLS